MTLHYHGTPITPNSALYSTAGKMFCVSYWRPDQIHICDRIGQSVMLDNGAYSAWKSGEAMDAEYWKGYYTWVEQWCQRPTTWAIIPDVIDGGYEDNERLLNNWPFGRTEQSVPVWHLDEPVQRVLKLIDRYPRVAFGSSGRYSEVGSTEWCRRMDNVWNKIANTHGRTPWVHMLRGMAMSKMDYPFASLDSTDVARHHNNRVLPDFTRLSGPAKDRTEIWDQQQCPPTFKKRMEQQCIFTGNESGGDATHEEDFSLAHTNGPQG